MENWSYSGGLPGRSGRVWKLWLGWVSAASLPHCRVQGPLLSQGPRVHLASPAPERERRPCCQLTQRWRWGSLDPINPLGSDEHTVMTATAGGIHSPRLCRRCPRSFAERGSVTCLKWPCVPLLPGRVSEGEALRWAVGMCKGVGGDRALACQRQCLREGSLEQESLVGQPCRAGGLQGEVNRPAFPSCPQFPVGFSLLVCSGLGAGSVF